MKFFFSICILQFLIVNILFSQSTTIHSISWTRQSSGDNGYTLDGTVMTSSRAKLLNTNNFGISGTYSKTVSIFDGYGTTGSLAQISSVPINNIFFFGGFILNNPSTQQFTSEEVDSVYNWSKRGGKLIIAANPNGFGYNLSILDSRWGFHDTLKSPSYLSPTIDGNNTDIFNGPFGTVSYATEGGSLQGYFDVIPANTKIFATDPNNGKPTLFMDCNTLDLIAADVDAYTSLSGISAGSAINNMQDIFWANTISFMDNLQPLPQITNSINNLSLNSSYNNYQWYLNGIPINGAVGPTYPTSESGNYFVEVIVNGGCKVKSNSITVDSLILADSLVIANVFTPNGDGINDNFTPIELKGITIKQISIFNRWGDLIHKENFPQILWDGKINNTNASDGVYYWIIEFQNLTETKNVTGFVQLNR